ncbi:30551_t:CDS:2, partial [Racocetra persica]
RRGDGGVDIRCWFKGRLILIQCKNWTNNIGPETIRSLRGVTCTEKRGTIGIVIGINFTTGAIREAEKSKIRPILLTTKDRYDVKITKL